jgi:DNA-binding LacI/PurR family transcriptional regulator
MIETMERNKLKAYQQIANYLREKIFSGELLPNSPIATENELSVKFNVSRGPVRQAMKSLTDEGIIYRIAGRGTFVSGTLKAAKESVIKPLEVTVLVDMESPMQAHRFLLDIIESLNSQVEKSYPPCNLTYQFGSISSEQARQNLARRDIDGLIFIPLNRIIMDFLGNIIPGKNTLPFVSLYRKVNSTRISQFSVVHEEGAFRATEYLLNLRHRRIATLLVAPINERVDSLERLKGYQRALRDNKVEFDGSLVLETGLSPANIKFKLMEILKRENPPTAILIGGNALLSPVSAALHEIGLKIPRDISVLVFDDSPEAEFFNPSLSVICQPSLKVAHYGLEKLFSMILLRDSTPFQAEFNPELLIRDSCCKN